MAQPGDQFANLLTEAIKQIKRKESKNIAVIQDELGYAIGKKGGSLIEYWRKGNVPSKFVDFECLMHELSKRVTLTRTEVIAFCESVDFPYQRRLLNDLFGEQPAPVAAIDTKTPSATTNNLPTQPIPEPAYLPSDSLMPLRRNPFFVGRQRDLQQIAEAFNQGWVTAIGQGQVAATTGLGGMGKTQLACEFVHRYGQFFKGGVFWLNFEDADAIPAKIAECGRAGRMDLHPHYSDLPLKDQVNLVVAAWEKRERRLLVFDNCESETVLQQWLPKSGGCRILVTSRRGAWDPVLGVQLLILGTLYPHESVSLLRSLSGVKDEEQLEKVAHELGHLPLALHLAGKYLSQYKEVVSIAGYLAQLKNRDLLSHPSLRSGGLSPTGHEQHVWRTFALSYNQLRPTHESDGLAIDLLVRAAHFAPGEPIWRKLLIKTLASSANNEQAELDAHDGFSRLVELGLVDVERGEILRMHRLVAAFVKDVAHDRVTATLEMVEQVVFEEAQHINEAGFPVPLLEWNLHLRSVTDVAVQRQDERGAYLCSAVGEHLRQLGDYQEARLYFDTALAFWKQFAGIDDARTAEGFHNVGRILRDLGELDEAKGYLEQALKSRLEILGDGHPLTAVSYNELGRWHFSKRDLTAAEKHFYQAVQISSVALGHTHIDSADYLNNLGMCMSYAHKNKEAIPFLKEALAIRKQILGDYHPRTALSLNNMGFVMQEMRQFEEAKHYYEQAFKIRASVLGENHRDTAECLNNLGVLHNDLREFAQARPILEKAVRIYENVYGTSHARLATALLNLGIAYQHLNESTASLQCLQRSYTIRKATFGLKHTLTRRVQKHILNVEQMSR